MTEQLNEHCSIISSSKSVIGPLLDRVYPCFAFPNYMRIVLTVPDDILREACNRISTFCQEHFVAGETLKEIESNIVSVANETQVILDNI